MKVELMAAALALCLASGTAIAQQSIIPSHGTNIGSSGLIRPCTSLRSTGDCAIGLPNRSLGGTGLMTNPNSMMQQNGSGLGSTFLRSQGAGPLEANGPTDRLSRGISRGGMAGSSLAVGPLGVDNDSLLRNGLGGGSLGGGSLSGRSAAGSLGGGSSRLR